MARTAASRTLRGHVVGQRFSDVRACGQNGITPVFLAHEALFQQIRKIAGKLKIIHKLFAKQRGLQLSLGEGRARVLNQIAQQDAYFGGCSEPARLYAGR